ncbi:alginate export family protein [Steroidobacter sp. S1-65]|uniref:Alginate export family protein n=1 Tax=Steroidobacter gossypii TaxID=2805490 RepID=A0ABS1X5Q4_9GAMM|nr:alginate export family protein [Steroidobacter gossypii]MBM0108546.1 alginate export family protein [Steroidobacter gossypii]
MSTANERCRTRSIVWASALSCAAVDAACVDIPDGYVQLGGEVRQRYEYTHNPGFGAEPQDTHGAWLQRYALHADVQWGRHLRAFVELHSALESGRASGPSRVDENELEFQNAFLEGRYSLSRDWDLHVRAGRQEVQLGSARLVSVRDGPNVRRTFDGLRVLAKTGAWTINALALSPRRDRPGVFDDSTHDSQLLWGVYATREPLETRKLGLDLYYLTREDDEAAYDQGNGAERRQTLGVRLFGSKAGWQWNIEPMLQFGKFDGRRLRAWTIASETGYTWSDRRWQPSVRLSANIASGDRDRSDPDLESFHPLFPRGNYFSEDAILGPQNFYNMHVFLTLNPLDSLTVTVDYNGFWRLSTDDGVYAPNGSLLRSAHGSDERWVATALSLTSEWTVNRHFSFTAIYTHFSPRRFLEQTGPSEAVDFVELTARFKF